MCSIGILSNVLDPRYVYASRSCQITSQLSGEQRHEWHSGGRTFGLHLYSGSIVLSHQLVLPSLRVDIGGRGIRTNTSPHSYLFAEPFASIWKTLFKTSETLQAFHPDIPYESVQDQLVMCCEKHGGFYDQIKEGTANDTFRWESAYDPDWGVARLNVAAYDCTSCPFL